jgi:ribosomal protein S18 acetylase RimI-like enzyme
VDGTAIRVAPSPAEPGTAQLTVAPGYGPPTTGAVRAALAHAAAGYAAAVTGALADSERAPFLEAGLTPRAWLHLLECPLDGRAPPSAAPGIVLRRIRRSEWPTVATVDAAAFAPFWRLGVDGIVDARRATPSNRMRVAAGRRDAVVGYAVFGRSGQRGFVQRIAVDPRCHGHGIGTALLLDGLRWLADRGVRSALVNTQIGNERALHLYQRAGFRLLRERLVVLGRSLDDQA